MVSNTLTSPYPQPQAKKHTKQELRNHFNPSLPGNGAFVPLKYKWMNNIHSAN